MRSPSIALVLADGSGSAAPTSSSFSFPQYDSGEIPYTLKTAGGVSIDISQPGRALTLRMRLGSTLIGRPAVQTAPGVGYFPIADGDTLAPVVAGPFVVDALYTDNADTLNTPAEVMLISTWTLLNAVAVPTSPITPLPSQIPLAVGPQGPTGATGPQPPLSSATPQPLGTASAGVGTTASRSDHVHATEIPAQGGNAGKFLTTNGSATSWGSIAAGNNWYNVKAYGAIGDGSTDDTAAIQAALTACSLAGGGVIYFPGASGAFLGRYRMSGQVSLTLNPGPAFPGGANQGIVFLGDGGTGSTIVVDAAGVTGGLFNFYSGMNMTFERLLFEPLNTANDGALDVGGSVISFDSVFELHVKDCWFNGIRAGQAIINAIDNDFTIENSQITGCSVVSGSSPVGAIIVSTLFSNLRIINNRFEGSKICQGRVIDKTGGQRSDAVLYANTPGNAAAHDVISAVNQNTIEIRGNKFAGVWFLNAIWMDAPSLGQSDLLYNRVLIEDNNIDVLTSTYRAILLYDAKYTRISRNWIGTSTAQGVGIELHNAGEVILEHNTPSIGFGGSAGATDLSVDAATTSVLAIENTFNSYLITDSAATPTTVIKGGVTARIRLSQGALVANTLGKPGATVGSVDQLATTDDATLTSGVILDAAGGAGVNVRVVEQRGQRVQVKSDGAGGLSPAQRFTSSGASAGRIKSVAAPGGIGLVDGTAAASADALAWVIF